MKNRSLMTVVGLPVLAALTFAVASCGGSSSSSTTTVAIPPGALVVTAGPGIVLDKAEYTIASTNGTVTIAYVQKDTQRHTLVVRGADGVGVGEKLEIVMAGSTDVGTYTLAPGTYTLQCDVPGHSAMKATLIVT